MQSCLLASRSLEWIVGIAGYACERRSRGATRMRREEKKRAIGQVIYR